MDYVTIKQITLSICRHSDTSKHGLSSRDSNVDTMTYITEG